MSNEKKEQQVFMCPVCCLGETKEAGHLMGPNCEERFQADVLEKLKHHQPVKTELDYAIGLTEGNIASQQEQLDELKNGSSTYWDQAYGEIQRECRGVRLPKEKFLQAVKTRFAEIMKNTGQPEIAEGIVSLGEIIANLNSQLDWLKSLKARQPNGKNNHAEEAAPAAD